MAKKHPETEFTISEPEPIKELEPVDERAERIKYLETRINEIVNEYGGVGNIPARPDHPFWDCMNELRRLKSEQV